MEHFYLWFYLLLGSYILFLFGYLQLSHQPDKVNNFLAFFALSFVFFNILIFLNLMFQVQEFHELILPLFCYVLGGAILIIGLLVIISSVLVNLYRAIFEVKDIAELEEKWNKRLEEMSKTKRDTYRKISHVLIFIGLFIIWYIGYRVVTDSTMQWAGMIPYTNNTFSLYLTLLTRVDYIEFGIYMLGWFYYLIFFFFYFLCIALLVNELTRKLKYLSFPFNLLPKLVMSEEEKESYGTYLYFAIGQLFAAFLCPPMVFFAILGMAGIGDLMTSQIGIRYGKRHIKWNSKKTWEGTIAGTITCLILCFFFVGIVWAIIFAIVFTIIDLATNKPIDASDNLLIPIGCAIVYVLLRFFFDLNYSTIIMQWF